MKTKDAKKAYNAIIRNHKNDMKEQQQKDQQKKDDKFADAYKNQLANYPDAGIVKEANKKKQEKNEAKLQQKEEGDDEVRPETPDENMAINEKKDAL